MTAAAAAVAPAAAEAAPAAAKDAPAPATLTVAGVTYDVSEFQARHPGGAFILQPFLGQDASQQFAAFHSKDAWELLRTLPRVRRGRDGRGRGRGCRTCVPWPARLPACLPALAPPPRAR